MSDSDTDAIVVYDRSSRRRFIRTGAAFLLAGGTISSGSPVLAGDCDRAASEHKNPDQAGSDSDTGEGADPEGCGRRKDKPKITRLNKSLDTTRAVEIVTVKG